MMVNNIFENFFPFGLFYYFLLLGHCIGWKRSLWRERGLKTFGINSINFYRVIIKKLDINIEAWTLIKATAKSLIDWNCVLRPLIINIEFSTFLHPESCIGLKHEKIIQPNGDNINKNPQFRVSTRIDRHLRTALNSPFTNSTSQFIWTAKQNLAFLLASVFQVDLWILNWFGNAFTSTYSHVRDGGRKMFVREPWRFKMLL